ncbi:hypothetical protein FisN_10Lu431 [Fistulifera solaris]|uniref:Uncharacterized protein n=1 Tax=Fistulifera solaris TaxID=1519565 RepID=A0A1Z5JUJ6_FISSO|nr:hypothetical protein FisN_10Lu431 [Fistulifera solaris]|eukprot:GAX17713.1 hypothetical protein FisN_10Lu431 [Fistulifera solaris]
MRDTLLKLSPFKKLSPEQRFFRPEINQAALPIYIFTREPKHLDTSKWAKCDNFAIWRDNGTLICVSDEATVEYRHRRVCLRLIDKYDLFVAIYGKTDVAIAETLTFLGSLKDARKFDMTLIIGSHVSSQNDYRFDFTALQPQQLAQILDANPSRYFVFYAGTWNAEQSVILTTRSHPLNLALNDLITMWTDSNGVRTLIPGATAGDFAFIDRGTAFVDVLGERQSTFRSLSIDRNLQGMLFSPENLQRLCELAVLEKLRMDRQNRDCVLFPLTMKTNTLDYEIAAKHIQPEDFDTLDIAATNLEVKIDIGTEDDHYAMLLISFFNCVAELGHLEGLKLSFDRYGEVLHMGGTSRITEALIGAIKGNVYLKELDLSVTDYLFDEVRQRKNIFETLKYHKCLCKLVWSFKHFDADNDDDDGDDDEDDDDDSDVSCPFDYSLLEQLLSHNRDLTVINQYGEKISNGDTIDRLYALNDFYNGSARLGQECTPSRSSLVATTLQKSASISFQYTALLLADHADALVGFIHNMNLDDDGAAALMMDAAVSTVGVLKVFLCTTPIGVFHFCLRHCNLIG